MAARCGSTNFTSATGGNARGHTQAPAQAPRHHRRTRQPALARGGERCRRRQAQRETRQSAGRIGVRDHRKAVARTPRPGCGDREERHRGAGHGAARPRAVGQRRGQPRCAAGQAQVPEQRRRIRPPGRGQHRPAADAGREVGPFIAVRAGDGRRATRRRRFQPAQCVAPPDRRRRHRGLHPEPQDRQGSAGDRQALRHGILPIEPVRHGGTDRPPARSVHDRRGDRHLGVRGAPRSRPRASTSGWASAGKSWCWVSRRSRTTLR